MHRCCRAHLVLECYTHNAAIILYEGLVSGHAYSILDVRRIKSHNRTGPVTLKLIRIRNPWGSSEWSGDWGDKSEIWDQHAEVKAKLWSDQVVASVDVEVGRLCISRVVFSCCQYFEIIEQQEQPKQKQHNR